MQSGGQKMSKGYDVDLDLIQSHISEEDVEAPVGVEGACHDF